MFRSEIGTRNDWFHFNTKGPLCWVCFIKTSSHFFLLATIPLKFATRRDCLTRYRKEHISTQITQKGLNYSARDSELGTIGFLFNNEGPFCSVSTSTRFNVTAGNTFLGTIFPKPSILRTSLFRWKLTTRNNCFSL